MKAKFVGDANNPGEQKQLPDEFEAFGVTFERGKFVDVPDELAHKFANNSHYETRGEEPEAPPAPAPQPTSATAVSK